ncbi:MAG: hypothetical protein WBP81_11260 [Solirubrobacteraceae bacterium]
MHARPDGEIFSSFFRSPDSVICAATLLSEIGDCRPRYPHRDAIAADAGQAPVADKMSAVALSKQPLRLAPGHRRGRAELFRR